MLINPARENHADTAGRNIEPPEKDRLPPIPRRIYLIVCAVGLLMTSLLGYGFYTGYRISTTYAPLIDAAMEIKLEATAAHLGLEEVLNKDESEDYHTVLLHIEEATWYLRAMLEGGQNFEGTFVPVPDEALLRRVKDVQNKFARLKAMVMQRLRRVENQPPNDEIDQEHDARFRDFIKEVDLIETGLQQLMSQSLKRFRIVQIILIVACILFAAVTGIYFRRYERYRLENYWTLQRSYARLEKEIVKRKQAEAKVKNAYGDLELKVLERTRDLDDANKQLAREVIERRRAEKDLLNYHARLHALSSELSLSEERERRRIAEALHDGIGQNLSAISMGKLTRLRNRDSQEFDAELDDICDLIMRMIEQTRRLIFELAPSTLYELGLVAAVEELIDKVKKQYGLPIEFHGDGSAKIEDEGVRAFLFQSVRELLANIAQHAQARTARVSIRRETRNLRIDVTDDGIGFDAAAGHDDSGGNNGLGILKIRERMRYFGGTLEIESDANKGTHAVLIVPLK